MCCANETPAFLCHADVPMWTASLACLMRHLPSRDGYAWDGLTGCVPFNRPNAMQCPLCGLRRWG